MVIEIAVSAFLATTVIGILALWITIKGEDDE